MELVAGAAWSSWSQLVEVQDALEVGEQHLDLLPLAPGDHVGVGFSDAACHVPGALVDGAQDLAGGMLRTAALFQRTGAAVAHGGPITHETFGIDADPRLLELTPIMLQLLASRADVKVALVVVGEVGAAKRAILAVRLVEHRDVAQMALPFRCGSIPCSCTSQSSMAAEP